ncbi:hypothetical protein KKF55_00175 [Patescibacteria group bacterium]|nr:hypothetical protein [Patescibacteria group bacterium]
MKRLLLIFGALALGACTTEVKSPAPLASYALSLYPHALWSDPVEAERSFVWEDEETTVQGREVTGTYDEGEQNSLQYSDIQFADEDFWKFYLEEETLKKIGYETIFVEEEEYDRQFVGLRDEEGHVLLLSNIIDFDTDIAFAPECPCKYTFTIFTNDERVELSEE